MLRKTLRRCAEAVDAKTGYAKPNLGIPEFFDPNFLANKRPILPGGSWPKDLLERKSMADLQQIWFLLLKERNMLLSMKEHYLKHMEELGAFPAPSRLKMVEESMANVKDVVKQRDFQATDKAMQIFMDRLKKGVYRYPPGPQLPPATDDPTSKICFKLSKYVPEERLKELLGRYDVFEPHKGIVSLSLSLPPEVEQAKKQAEEAWEEWRGKVLDYEAYQKTEAIGVSEFDIFQDVELAPGIFYGNKLIEKMSRGAATEADGENTEEKAKDGVDVLELAQQDDDILIAHKIPVPSPQTVAPISSDPIKRIRDEALPVTQRRNLQLGYFPNVTLSRPEEPGPRPKHPDEILGPWICEICYDRPDGFKYVMEELEVKAIDGAAVTDVEDVTTPRPFAERCPIYQEAIRAEEADAQHQLNWPRIQPLTEEEVEDLRIKPLEDIITHNWSNTMDYTEREALLTGRSLWELPINVDPSCGDADKVPPNWERPDKGILDQTPFLWDEY